MSLIKPVAPRMQRVEKGAGARLAPLVEPADPEPKVRRVWTLREFRIWTVGVFAGCITTIVAGVIVIPVIDWYAVCATVGLK